MKYTYALTLALGLLSIHSPAQQIKPTDFIQLYKYYQLNESKFGKSAFEYLQTVDTKWSIASNPTINEKGVTVDFAYSKDGKAWYQPEVYHLMFSHDYGPPSQRAIVYTFKESETWTLFNGQMVLMNAKKIGSSPNTGGSQTIYIVGNMVFTLAEFPPGINGDERSFQVTLMNDTISK